MSDNKTQIEQLKSLKNAAVKPVKVNDTVYVSLDDYLHVVNELEKSLGLSGMSSGSISKPKTILVSFPSNSPILNNEEVISLKTIIDKLFVNNVKLDITYPNH